MLENMVTSLLSHQQITTTLSKAKEAKKLADRVINLGKTDSLHSRRMVFSYLQDHALTSKLFKEVAPRFKNRAGGYTRILQLSRRKGDGAQLALLELTEKDIKVKEAKPKKAKDVKDAKAHDHSHDAPAQGKHKHEAPDKSPSQKGEAKKGGFFKNVSKFFRNKGGG